MFKLKKIHLTDFCSFDDVEIDIQPDVEVLTGLSGSGKSSVYMAFAEFIRHFCDVLIDNKQPYSITSYVINRNNIGNARIEVVTDSFMWDVVVKRSNHKKVSNPVLFGDNLLREWVSGLDLNNSVLPVLYSCNYLYQILPTTADVFDVRRSVTDRLCGIKYNSFNPGVVYKHIMDSCDSSVISLFTAVLESVFGDFETNSDFDYSGLLYFRSEVGGFDSMDRENNSTYMLFTFVLNLFWKYYVMNYGKVSIEDTPGIVVVDDFLATSCIDMQYTVFTRLMNTFPSIQWIVTTGSPGVISAVYNRSVVRLYEGRSVDYFDRQTYGANYDSIMGQMGMYWQPKDNKFVQLLSDYATLIEGLRLDSGLDNEQLNDLRKRLDDLESVLSDHYGSDYPDIMHGKIRRMVLEKSRTKN